MQEKVIRVLQVKQKTKDFILCKEIEEITAISRINKTTSTLFRNQKAMPVGACHDVVMIINYYILCKKFEEITAISRIYKTTSTLFRNQKAVPVGACHDVRDFSYDKLYI